MFGCEECRVESFNRTEATVAWLASNGYTGVWLVNKSGHTPSNELNFTVVLMLCSFTELGTWMVPLLQVLVKVTP